MSTLHCITGRWKPTSSKIFQPVSYKTVTRSRQRIKTLRLPANRCQPCHIIIDVSQNYSFEVQTDFTLTHLRDVSGAQSLRKCCWVESIITRYSSRTSLDSLIGPCRSLWLFSTHYRGHLVVQRGRTRKPSKSTSALHKVCWPVWVQSSVGVP